MANFVTPIDGIQHVTDPSLTDTPGVTLGGGAYGSGVLATTAIEGFPHIPVMAGTPTGVPTLKAGFVPIVFDSTGVKLWVYANGAWRGVVVA